jgi:hypothetical protein
MKWFKDTFQNQSPWFEKSARELTGGQTDATYDKHFAKLQDLYKNAPLVDLTPSLWKTLGNTDSNKKMTMSDIRKVIVRNKTSRPRDIFMSISQICNEQAPAPIILMFKGKPNLISGNDILMAARLLEVTPKVVLITWR